MNVANRIHRHNYSYFTTIQNLVKLLNAFVTYGGGADPYGSLGLPGEEQH